MDALGCSLGEEKTHPVFLVVHYCDLIRRQRMCLPIREYLLPASLA